MHNDSGRAAHLLTGEHGERAAEKYLRAHGMNVLHTNWRPPAGMAPRGASLELDIIARDRDTTVFVEVKTRSFTPGGAFSPLDAFTPAKRGKVMRAAQLYLEAHKAWSSPCRFDLVCIVLMADNSTKTEHYKDVLTFEQPSGGTVAGRHASWQPW